MTYQIESKISLVQTDNQIKFRFSLVLRDNH